MNRSHFLSVIGFATLALLVLSTTGCAVMGLSNLSADPIDARVIDADTGQPIEGVVAVAYWELNKGSLAGDSLPCGSANVEEAVTDKDGRFHLPAWGPIKNPCGGVMEEYEPTIYLFKPGYHHGQIATNGIGSYRAVSSTGGGWWSAHPIELKRFTDINYYDEKPGSYYSDFSSLDISIGTFVVHMPYQCNWKRIPKMLRALELERRKFRLQGYGVDGVTNQLVANDSWFQQVAPACGSPKAFMEGILK